MQRCHLGVGALVLQLLHRLDALDEVLRDVRELWRCLRCSGTRPARWDPPHTIPIGVKRQCLARGWRNQLEIGFGSGLNLPTTMQRSTRSSESTPRPRCWLWRKERSQPPTTKMALLARSADDLPLDDQSIDTIVVTWSLCSIVDVGRSLMEARRVLRPGRQMRFVEHGLSPDPNVAIWQDRLTPLWRRCAGGCHLNRKIDDLIRGAGFRLAELKADYAPGPRAMTYMYEGEAM